MILVGLGFFFLPLAELLSPLILGRTGGVSDLVIEILFFRSKRVLLGCPLCVKQAECLIFGSLPSSIGSRLRRWGRGSIALVGLMRGWRSIPGSCIRRRRSGAWGRRSARCSIRARPGVLLTGLFRSRGSRWSFDWYRTRAWHCRRAWCCGWRRSDRGLFYHRGWCLD
jgi:hypothetical protein